MIKSIHKLYKNIVPYNQCQTIKSLQLHMFYSWSFILLYIISTDKRNSHLKHEISLNCEYCIDHYWFTEESIKMSIEIRMTEILYIINQVYRSTKWIHFPIEYSPVKYYFRFQCKVLKFVVDMCDTFWFRLSFNKYVLSGLVIYYRAYYACSGFHPLIFI